MGWYWDLPTSAYCLFLTFGSYLSLRVFFQRSEAEDKVTLRVYMVSLVHLLVYLLVLVNILLTSLKAWLTIARTLPFLQAHGTLFMN